MNTKYQRSDSYRASFMRHWPPKHGYYHCVYCGKKLRPDQMEVDHVIPVGAVRHNLLYRLLVPADGVNSLSNLVPSCSKCNNRKGRKCGLWMIRGKFWKICLPLNIIIHLAMYVFVAAVIFMSFAQIQPEMIQSVISQILDMLSHTQLWSNIFK